MNYTLRNRDRTDHTISRDAAETLLASGACERCPECSDDTTTVLHVHIADLEIDPGGRPSPFYHPEQWKV